MRLFDSFVKRKFYTKLNKLNKKQLGGYHQKIYICSPTRERPKPKLYMKLFARYSLLCLGYLAAGVCSTKAQVLTENDSTAVIASTDSFPTQEVAPKKLNLVQKVVKYFNDSNEPHPDKKFDFGIIGGPHYSSTTKLGLGIVASGTYRMRRDSLTQLSNVSIYGDATTTGFLLIGVKGNNIFPENKYRIDYDFYLYTFPSDFWGIGYDNGNNNDNKSSYNRLETILRIDWMARLHKDLYGGISTGFNWVKGSDFTKPALLNGEPHEVISTSLGLTLTYDSRDFIPNAARGVYFNVRQRFFPRFLGNKQSFTRTAFIFDFYQRTWKGAILAFDLHGEFNYGNVPWNMLASLGGSTRMRGYYEGRYRDKSLIEAQLELRQHIWRRNGIAIWVGAGNVFPSFSRFDWGHTLPNYGIGYRWEFKNRVNLRLDYGFGKKGQSGFLFNINEAF